MARIIQLISPMLRQPLPRHFFLGKTLVLSSAYLLSGLLILFSFYFAHLSQSNLFLGIATLQTSVGMLMVLEGVLQRLEIGPLESRRVEMTAYCVGGAFIVLLCIYQFSEAFLHLQTVSRLGISEIMTSILASILGNLVLLRLLWQSGLIRGRPRLIAKPLLGIFAINILCFSATIIIYVSQYHSLDAVLSLVVAAVLFVLTASIMIDAYWKLREVEQKGLNSEAIDPVGL